MLHSAGWSASIVSLIGVPLTQIGQAAPVVAALIKGTDKERVVSEQYGGSGGQQASTDEVYSAIGNVSCAPNLSSHLPVS